ncbi:sensor histidine kinase [Streptomyces sp. 4N509B]|uniref:sensor histidine kinase n=1 Tax=Streptomyces sp. 4N509B TaxID=3457413 RepID=UPI003FD6502E
MSARDRAVDLGCVTLSALVALLFVANNGVVVRPVEGLYLVTSVSLTAAACAALWWRRRWPLPVGLLGVAISSYTEFAAGAALTGAFTVATHCRPRVTLVVLAVACGGAVPYSLARPDPDLQAQGADAGGQVVFGVLFTLFLLLPVQLWGMWIRARRQRLAGLRERATRAEAEAALVADRVRRQEREHIAREMHDVLAHRLTLLSLHAGALEVRPDMGPAQVASVAGTIRTTAHQALDDLREILGVLRPDRNGSVAVRPPSGLADITELVEESRAAGVPVSLDCRLAEADGATLPPSVSRTAYRVVQEGLTNARKHAPGTEVRVFVDRAADGGLRLGLRNALPAAGSAAPAAPPGSRSGLLGLSERVSLAGGRLEYGARRGGRERESGGGVDFALEAWLPWPT